MPDPRTFSALYPAAAMVAAAVLYGGAMAAPQGSSAGVVYRLRHDSQAADGISSPGVAVVAGAVSGDGANAEHVYRAAAGGPLPVLASGGGATVLAAGPMLDGPDQVVAMPGEWHGRRFEIEMRHTSANLSGKDLLRNLPWRPLASVSLADIPAGGVCEVVVRWQPVESLPNGKALAQPLVTTASFRVE